VSASFISPLCARPGYLIWVILYLQGACACVCGDSQARGLIGAVAAGLHHSHSHSNVGSEPCLQPTPQLTPMLDP